MHFDEGTLPLTEASSKKRASLHSIGADVPMTEFHRGGREILAASHDEVTAFHPEMAVHGRFGQRCPDCDTSKVA